METTGYIPRELETELKHYTYTHMFTAALSTITNRQKQPKCPSADEQTKRMWCIHKKEYSVSKRNEGLICPNPRMNGEVTLSEIN